MDLRRQELVLPTGRIDKRIYDVPHGLELIMPNLLLGLHAIPERKRNGSYTVGILHSTPAQYLTGWIFGRPERQRREAHFPQCLQYASHFIAVLPKDEQNNGLTQDVSLDARIRKTASRRASRATCQVLRYACMGSSSRSGAA